MIQAFEQLGPDLFFSIDCYLHDQRDVTLLLYARDSVLQLVQFNLAGFVYISVTNKGHILLSKLDWFIHML